MKQVRVSITADSTGKITGATLQEAYAFDTDGTIHWRDIRPLEVTPDGQVVLFREELEANAEQNSRHADGSGE